MEPSVQTWQSYENVARVVLSDLRARLGISDVSGYSRLSGTSGTNWSIEGSAVRTSDGAFLIIECRRHTTHGLSQESVGGLAYRIQDTGAGGAILVTPLELQRGAELVARAESIVHVRLEPWSTSENYLAEFMGRNFHKVSVTDSFAVSDRAEAFVYRNGKLVD
jgi:hypothetical protein